MSNGDAKSQAEWLKEALLLEQLGSEWRVGHAAAYCTLSVSALYRSSCPRVEKRGERAVKGRPSVRFVPVKVREWNAARTMRQVA